MKTFLPKAVIPFTLIFMFFSFALQGQYGKQKKADALYRNYSFVQAAALYEELANANYNREYAYRQLGDCYFYMRDFEKAAGFYKQAVANETVPASYYYQYAVTLRYLGRTAEAREWMEKYQKNGGSGKLARNWEASEISLSAATAQPLFEVQKASINSKFSDFGMYEKNGIYYLVTSRPQSEGESRKYGWNEQPYLDLWQIDSTGAAQLVPLPGEINSRFHEGPVSITNDGNTMYFSRNNFFNNHKVTDREGVNHLKIYRARRNGQSWEQVEELAINSDLYSNAHPALSPDNKYLYFASDRPGGLGKTDLYRVPLKTDGSFGAVENLGEPINTSEDEMFPFINAEGQLFFSSDGHAGYGALDIFTQVSGQGALQPQVINMGEPINSQADDFSFYMSTEGDHGYFASNRNNPVIDDDIYRYERILPLMLKGVVSDSINGKPIALARVSLKNDLGEEIAFVETDSTGYYEINIDRNSDYGITGSHRKYKEKSKSFTTRKLSRKTREIIVNLELVPVDDIRILADLQTIYFDFDRYNIRPDAAKELDKIVRLLLDEYPNMVMSLEAHTDSRGSFSYNDKLSIDRANATYNYLVAHGLPPERIINKTGYGERRLTNGCEDGVHCEEPEHQRNRRTDFRVVRPQ